MRVHDIRQADSVVALGVEDPGGEIAYRRDDSEDRRQRDRAAGVPTDRRLTTITIRKNRRSRTEETAEIAKGAEVIVIRYERGIAYVRGWDGADVPAVARNPRVES